MSSQPTPRTRVGPIRLGIEYQDAVALSLLVDWLGDRNRYARIRFEDSENSGSLDDIRAEKPDGTIELRQVKYAVDPDTEDGAWSWDSLLKTGKRARKSLLASWAESFHQVAVDGKRVAVEIITNRRGDVELAASMPKGRLDLDKVPRPSIREELLRQLGGEEDARAFLLSCQFRFSQPSLAELHEGARRRFNQLGGTSDGWVGLEAQVKRWHIEKTDAFRADGYVTLQALLRAACWNRLRPLPQEVEVPPDFHIPDKTFHNALLDELAHNPKPCTVVVGAPGVGKSTYTSHLFAELQRQGVPVIRHHYHLSFVRRDAARLDHRTAAGSLLHDLCESFGESLGEKTAHNPDPDKLRDYLSEAGAFYSKQNKCLIVLVDGLDHVWRDRNSTEELRRLFELLLPASPGVALLVATQPIEDEKLPNTLLCVAPRHQWRQLPNMDRIAVESWLNHHWPEVRPAASDGTQAFHFDRGVDALHRRSLGHPLHLRYTVEALKAAGRPATPDNVNVLPACTHAEITNYYAELWRALSQAGKLVTQLLAACPFPWPSGGIASVLRREGISLLDSQLAQRSVEHLLSQTGLGLQPFHRSLALWIEDQREFSEVAVRLRRSTVDWLTFEAPEFFRWAYLWPLQADLDDPSPLLNGLTRSWVVAAIAERRSWRIASALLHRGARVATQTGRYERAVAIGLLVEYFSYYTENDFGLQDLLQAQLAAPKDPELSMRLHQDLDYLRDQELVWLAENARDRADQETVEHCFRQLLRRFHEALDKGRDQHRHDPSEADPGRAIRVELLAESEGPFEWALHLIERNIRHPLTTSWVRAAMDQCWRSRLVARARRIFRFIARLTPAPAAGIVEVAATGGFLLSLDEEADFTAEFTEPPFTGRAETILHALLHKRPTTAIPSPPVVGNFNRPLESTQHREAASWICVQAFRFFLANHLLSRRKSNEDWLAEFPPREWLPDFLAALEKGTATIATEINSGQVPGVAWLYTIFDSLRGPRELPRRFEESHELAMGACDALIQLAVELLCYRRALGQPGVLQDAEIREVFASKFTFSGRFLEELAEQRRAWLTTKALNWLIHQKTAELEETVEEFSSRAEVYRSLAIVSAWHGRAADCQRLSYLAADNFFSHGNHKYYLLHRGLDAIGEFSGVPTKSDADRKEIAGWLLQLAVPIEYVGGFTDGDETSHLPEELASVILKGAPQLFLPYYRHLCSSESYADATGAFNRFIAEADLRDPVAQCLAQTALDRRALRAIDRRVLDGDKDAQAVKTVLKRELGNGAFDDLEDDFSSPKTPREAVFDSPPSPDAFPPSKLQEFLALSKAAGELPDAFLGRWLNYWQVLASPLDLFGALRAAAETSSLYFRHWNELYQLACRHLGIDAAFSWLVKAQIEDHGWQAGWTSDDRTRWRFLQVCTNYPSRWEEFFRGSILSTWESFGRGGVLGHGAWPRIIMFLVAVGQIERARALLNQMIESTLEMVTSQRLDPPLWVREQTQSLQ